MHEALRIVVIAPDLDIADPGDTQALDQAERSRSLRIGLLESGFNLIAALPADTFLHERLAQLQPDMIILDAESDARDALEHVVMATRDARRPIVMFTDDEDKAILTFVVYFASGFTSRRLQRSLPACSIFCRISGACRAGGYTSAWRELSPARCFTISACPCFPRRQRPLNQAMQP